MKLELVFVPYPIIGHLRSTIEMAKLLVHQNNRLSISIIVLPFLSTDQINASAFLASFSASSNDRLRFEVISCGDQPNDEFLVENQISNVRNAVTKLVDDYSKLPDLPRLAGFVVDMFCTSMVDVANEFGVPCYLFYTTNVGILALSLHIQMLYDKNEYDVSESEFQDSEAMLDIPSLTRPYPVKCLPYGFASKEWLPMYINQAKQIREMKGILVNSVAELEPYALESLLTGDTPPVYPVGPILMHVDNDVNGSKASEILWWLDEQPPSSVVFLCFGSIGGFNEEQAREIAIALEQSGHSFLWSLRRASSDLEKELPGEFTNLEEILPEGFLDRTKDRGKVIGWAPQMAVLAKSAIGGFITHCGWNSMLESFWFGVPTMAWPLYAEQKFNAFMLVEELGLAVEMKKFWRGDQLIGAATVMVTAEEIERGIRCLMEQDSDVRKKVKLMRDKCHVALIDGGSSQISMQKFIQNVMTNIA